ncbi:MAG: HAD-IIIA family hydrolase [Eubacteriales bacterium]|nr:HAD-IIIA family hydrolase [Eubacteriales bacterium]MDD4422077.1 HAD-IIIA family hydrolase [Eubacteriales bacterium]HBR32150.1 HAD family hydrolase [Clostridiales bacterium]
MSKYHTVLFDLDGTLLDTLGDLTDGVNYVLSRFSFEKRTKEEVRSFIGNGIPTLLRRSLPAGINDTLHSEAVKAFGEYYGKNLMNMTRPYPGIPELLDSLSAYGYKIGVVSNKKSDAVRELCAYFFNKIDIALGADGEHTRKPSPNLVFEALSLLDSDKNSAVFVGDSDVDIMTAKNAGIDIICVGWGYRDTGFLKSWGAKAVVSDTSSLLELLTT